EGFHIGRDKTARLMKLAGVSGRRRGRTPVTTISPKTPDHRPDLVCRNFRAQAPGRLWVADITYVRTLSGFAYTAFVVDVFYKAELIHARGPWTSVGEVELATLRWVHWWNTKRLHEALDYAT
ncbi:integrase core domain-containing protein, partial [Corynebacterium phoceense]|uniref:integrase core domain-containing protein n=1 Tax=Corynebacterium phoceense TaxID=1686286 RepID=UPI00211C76D8